MRIRRQALSIFLTLLCSLNAHAEIPGLDAIGIKHTVKKHEFRPRGDLSLSGPRHATDNHTLEVTVGPLSRAQYDALAKAMAGAALAPPYQPGALYRLEQFLTPAMQALLNKQFKPIQEKYPWPALKENDGSVELQDLDNFAMYETPLSTFINCWTTAYEVLRTWKSGESEIDITWLSRAQASGIFTEEAMSPLNAKDALRFGDAIVFVSFDDGAGMDLVQHAAIVVTPGLYFEKSDSFEDDAFRFISEKDLLAKYRSIFKKKLRFGHYRLKADAKLPRLRDTLNLLEYRDVYGAYFSEEDLRTIAFQFDWVAGLAGFSKPVTQPLRMGSIGIVKQENGYALDQKAKIYPSFREPDYRR